MTASDCDERKQRLARLEGLQRCFFFFYVVHWPIRGIYQPKSTSVKIEFFDNPCFSIPGSRIN